MRVHIDEGLYYAMWGSVFLKSYSAAVFIWIGLEMLKGKLKKTYSPT